jgi:serine/threonine-protein kinase
MPDPSLRPDVRAIDAEVVKGMEAGQTIAGKYRLNRVLGTGGMASVWSATNVFTEREFAIKFMHPQVARTPEAARRFLLEAKVSARINHPNIIEVIDVGQAEDGSLFLVMELLTGMSLDVATRRQSPPMAVADFLGIMKEVAEALAAAHRSGVVHRDLKPTNVFLHTDRDGRVVPKLLDFGVSKILEEEKSTSLTQVGTVLGSPLYMSPEQAMGAEGIDGRTDVFAFGSILFESLTGRRAYSAPNFNALIVAIATTQPQSVDEVAPNLPLPLRALVRDCMVTDKAQRLASFDLVVDRLNAMAPALAEAKLNLPPQQHLDVPASPEAPSARGMVRSSDRPPASAAANPHDAASSLPPAGPSPLVMQITTPSAFPRPSAAPRGGWLTQTATFVRGVPPIVLAASGGATVLFLVVILGFGAAFRRAGDTAQGGRGGEPAPGMQAPAATPAASIPASPPSVPTASAYAPTTGEGARPAAATADDPSSVPVIPVDSLPVATRTAPPVKGNGRLSIAASPGHCAVSVDGVPRGPTPLAPLELPAGTHRVDCATASGKSRAATVTVAEGGATHYKFTLDE